MTLPQFQRKRRRQWDGTGYRLIIRRHLRVAMTRHHTVNHFGAVIAAYAGDDRIQIAGLALQRDVGQVHQIEPYDDRQAQNQQHQRQHSQWFAVPVFEHAPGGLLAGRKGRGLESSTGGHLDGLVLDGITVGRHWAATWCCLWLFNSRSVQASDRVRQFLLNRNFDGLSCINCISSLGGGNPLRVFVQCIHRKATQRHKLNRKE